MNLIFKLFLVVILIPAAQFAIMELIDVFVIKEIVSNGGMVQLLVDRFYQEASRTCLFVYAGLFVMYFIFLAIMLWIKNPKIRMILTLLFWIVPSAFFANQIMSFGNSFVSFLGHLCYNGIYYLPFLIPNLLDPTSTKTQLS